MSTDESPTGLMPLALLFELVGAALLLGAFDIIPGFFDASNTPRGVIVAAGLAFLAAGGLASLSDSRLQVFRGAAWFMATRLALELILLGALGATFAWVGFVEGDWVFILPAALTGFIMLAHALRGIIKISQTGTGLQE